MQKEIKSSKLSFRRRLITILLFISLLLVRYVLNLFIKSNTLSTMLAMNVFGTIMIIYDWDLYALHYNRAKSNLLTTFIFTAFGIILIGLWAWADSYFLHAKLLLPDLHLVANYQFSIPAVIIAYSFMQSSIVNIVFKVLTDHLSIHNREFLVILLSGLVCGLIYTISYVNVFDYATFILSYLYNVVLIQIISYLYNQTHSFIPGILSMGFVYLIRILI